jgi:hypothetical protein
LEYEFFTEVPELLLLPVELLLVEEPAPLPDELFVLPAAVAAASLFVNVGDVVDVPAMLATA